MQVLFEKHNLKGVDLNILCQILDTVEERILYNVMEEFLQNEFEIKYFLKCSYKEYHNVFIFIYIYGKTFNNK